MTEITAEPKVAKIEPSGIQLLKVASVMHSLNMR